MKNWDNQWRMPDYNNSAWARAVSKTKVNVSDFNSITLSGGIFKVDNYEGKTGLRFALTSSSDGSRRGDKKRTNT